jgi:Flp pilus assembly protein TadG
MHRSFRQTIAAAARSFRTNRKGQVAITFGLAMLPMIVVTGAAVDYSRAVAQRSNLQQATDATVLAIAHSYLNLASTSATLFTPTQTYLTGAMNAVTPGATTVTYNGVVAPTNVAVLQTITLSQNNTQMCITSALIVGNSIMTIVRQPYTLVKADACSQVPQTYEVALVLDNSGSMAESAGGQSKMQALITAASQLVDTLIPPATINPSVAISITPFTALVNVGTSTTAKFLDTAGASSIHWQNFHLPTKAPWNPTSKLDLYTQLTNVDWGGCVEDRPYPYMTTDTAAATATPDSMFVPFLSPDDPGGVNNNSGYACYPTGSSYCGRYVPPYIFYNSYLSDNGSVASSAGGNCATSTTYSTADNATGVGTDGTTNQYPGAGLTMVCKYKNAVATMQSISTGIKTGPNYLCSSQQLTPLTTNNTTLKSAVSTMVAGGSTNLATGFMWGWRTISPIVNPFPAPTSVTIGQQTPKSYVPSTPQNNKIIILMTDGYNSWSGNPYSPWQSDYESFGYYTNGRLANYSTTCGGGSSSTGGNVTNSGSFRCQMDNVTAEACTNAKAAGITIYTVGFTIASDPIDTQGITLLQNCASQPANFFKATDGTSIVAAFQQIASSILNTRLSQ